MQPLYDSFFSKKNTINIKGELFSLEKPKIMAILNITPDSFFDGGSYLNEQQISRRVDEIISQGADIIDIGGYSSRPGAANISIDEEKNRLAKALQIIQAKNVNTIISIDTFRSEIARWAVGEFGVDIINDISAGEMDNKMFDTISELNVPYLMMHMRGTPQDMQQHTIYDHLIKDVFKYFAQKVDLLRLKGVNDIIIDPGFGFSKTIEQNYLLLKKLETFKIFELPILVGVSRKSMIYKSLNINALEALNGTSALHMYALMNGANILRVHDVKEAKEIVLLHELLSKN